MALLSMSLERCEGIYSMGGMAKLPGGNVRPSATL